MIIDWLSDNMVGLKKYCSCYYNIRFNIIWRYWLNYKMKIKWRYTVGQFISSIANKFSLDFASVETLKISYVKPYNTDYLFIQNVSNQNLFWQLIVGEIFLF